METRIINRLDLCTKMEVWSPKYNSNSLSQEYGEPVALLHKRKVDFGAPVIIVTFPKAKHLQGQRFSISKREAMNHNIGTNGRAPMYEIPLSHFQPWETAAEIKAKVNSMFA